jgi:serine protease Do
MRVGDTTFAVGAPLDAAVYSWSVTRGILSGKNRLVEVSSQSGRGSFIMEVLQTDTAINSGNSGGPLCNSNGEVIGVTNMKLASSSIEGMGFAIPIDDAVSYAESIISGKGIERPYLGVSLSDYVSDNSNSGGGIFRFFNFANIKTGVFIQTVEKDSPADKAGIKVGDNIKKVNGVAVEDVSHFKYELYKCEIGKPVTITIERDGALKEVSVTLVSNLGKK